MVYLFAASMCFIWLVSLRAAYVGKLFYYYVEECYPDIAREFKHHFPFVKIHPLYKQYDINDPEFHRRQEKARNAVRWVGFSLLVPVLLMIGFFVFGA